MSQTRPTSIHPESPARPRVVTGAVCLVIGAVVAIGLAAAAGWTSSKPARVPTAMVATFDLGRVIEGLDQVKKMEQAMSEKNQQRLDTITAAEAKFEELTKSYEATLSVVGDQDDPKALEAFEKAVVQEARVQALKQRLDNQFDREAAEEFLRIGKLVEDGAKKLAERSGYTIVISSDLTLPPPSFSRDPRADNYGRANRFVTERRFFYVAPEHDITEDLVNFLNNEFAAG